MRRSQEVSLVGTDLHSGSIEWCRANFPFGRFLLNRKRPPIELPAATVGFVYSISVFSHLSEKNHLEWLRELARVTRPGALLVLTVHGWHSLRKAQREEPFFLRFGVTREVFGRAGSDLERRGFAFISQPGGHLDQSLYGITFLADDYVRRSWSSDFDVLRYEDGALDDWQDVVVLRRKT